MAGHAVVPQLTVPSAPHRHIRRDSTADVGILSRTAAETEARLLRVHAGIRGTRAAGVPACTCTRRSWVAPLPGAGWAKATRSPWSGPGVSVGRGGPDTQVAMAGLPWRPPVHALRGRYCTDGRAERAGRGTRAVRCRPGHRLLP